jgi:hypothetical protein
MALNWRSLAIRSTGRYLAFLNDDDIWDTDYLATLVPQLESCPDAIVAFCDHWIVNEAGKIDEVRTYANSHRWMRDAIFEGLHRPFTRIALLYRAIWTASAAVIRRDAIDWNAIPAACGVGVDLYIAYLAARTGEGAWYCDKRLVHYRVHDKSTTASFASIEALMRCSRNAMFYWHEFAEDARVSSIEPYFRIKLLQNKFRFGVCSWLLGQPNMKVFALVMMLDPGLISNYIKYMLQLRRISI